MRSFTNKKIEKSLQLSIDVMTSKNLSPIKDIDFKEKYKMKKRYKFLPVFASVFVLLVTISGIGVNYYNKNLRINSSITLDVNPSIVLSTNYYNKIIKATALNDDGEEILKDIKVDNLIAEEATNIIIDELIKEGYLEGDGANILLTIQNNDLEKAKELESVLSKYINNKLDEDYIAGTVLTQVDTRRKNIDENIKVLMNTYNISYSKAVFVSKVVSKDESLVIADIATLKISEISKLVNEKRISVEDIVGYNVEDKLYESSELTQLRKNKDVAEEAKVKAEIKLQNVEEKINSKTQNTNEAEAVKKEYEEAEQAREKALKDALAAFKAYEEAEKAKNQEKSQENDEDIQNTSNRTETGTSTNQTQEIITKPGSNNNSNGVSNNGAVSNGR